MKDWIKPVIVGTIGGLLGGMLCLIVLAIAYNNSGVFGNVADWFGAVGTISAVWIALYLRKGKPIIEIQAHIKMVPHLVDWGDTDQNGETLYENHGYKLEVRIFASNLGNADVLITDMCTRVLENYEYKFIEKPMVLKSGCVTEIESDGTYGNPFEEPFRKHNLDFIKTNNSQLIVKTHNGKTYKSKIVISA